MKRLSVALVLVALITLPVHSQWHEVPVTFPNGQSYVWQGIFFLDSLNGWVVADVSNHLARTRDGGRTWQPQLLPVPTQAAGFGGIYFADTLHGIIVGKSGYGNGPGVIIRTTNGGQTWSQVTHPAVNSLWEEIAVVGDSLWVIGSYWDNSRSYHGIMLRTPVSSLFSSSPIPWTFYQYPQFRGFIRASVVNPNLVWIAGGGWNDTTANWQASLVHTTDGGRTFLNDVHKVVTGTNAITEIAFADTQSGWLGVDAVSGQSWVTNNGGDTWTLQTQWPSAPKILPLGNGNLLTSSYDFTLSHTRIWKSTNAGASWAVIADGSVISDPRKFFKLDSQHMWLVGGSSIWYYQYEPPPPIPSPPAPLLPVSGVVGVNTSPVLMWGATAGAAWYRLQLGDDSTFVAPTVLVVDTVLVDTSLQLTGLANAHRYYWRVRAGNSGGASAWSEVFNFTTSTTGVNELPGVPTEYTLSQNYPNPFNPTTVIRYSIPQVALVRLTVYNLLGQEVVVLVSEHQTVGIYEADFNASHLPSGTYFYRLVAGTYSATKKMLLVK